MFLLSDGDSFFRAAAGVLSAVCMGSKDDSETSDAPEEHQKHHDVFGKRPQIVGDADGKADGSQGRSVSKALSIRRMRQ